jgi:hypothetical protein
VSGQRFQHRDDAAPLDRERSEQEVLDAGIGELGELPGAVLGGAGDGELVHEAVGEQPDDGLPVALLTRS